MHDFNIGGSEAPKPAANKPLQRDLTGFDGIDAVRFAPHVPIGSGTQPPRYHLESRISRHAQKMSIDTQGGSQACRMKNRTTRRAIT